MLFRSAMTSIISKDSPSYHRDQNKSIERVPHRIRSQGGGMRLLIQLIDNINTWSSGIKIPKRINSQVAHPNVNCSGPTTPLVGEARRHVVIQLNLCGTTNECLSGDSKQIILRISRKCLSTRLLFISLNIIVLFILRGRWTYKTTKKRFQFDFFGEWNIFSRLGVDRSCSN